MFAQLLPVWNSPVFTCVHLTYILYLVNPCAYHSTGSYGSGKQKINHTNLQKLHGQIDQKYGTNVYMKRMYSYENKYLDVQQDFCQKLIPYEVAFL